MEVEEIETVELDGKRFIQLETYRQWPKLGVLWSVRQRSGDSDFPLARGSEEQLPRSGQDADEVWALLREQALAAAHDAAQGAAPEASGQKQTSFFGRLFRRD
jgi:hypothetical protein